MGILSFVQGYLTDDRLERVYSEIRVLAHAWADAEQNKVAADQVDNSCIQVLLTMNIQTLPYKEGIAIVEGWKAPAVSNPLYERLNTLHVNLGMRYGTRVVAQLQARFLESMTLTYNHTPEERKALVANLHNHPIIYLIPIVQTVLR